LTAVSCSLALAASVFLLMLPFGGGYWGGQYHGTTLLQICAPIIIFAFAILYGFSIGLFRPPAALSLGDSAPNRLDFPHYRGRPDGGRFEVLLIEAVFVRR